MSWLLLLLLLCEVSMASGNNGRRMYGGGVNPKLRPRPGNPIDPGGVNPKPFLGRPGFPIDPGGVTPPKPVAQPIDPGGVNPKTLFQQPGNPIDPGGVNPKPFLGGLPGGGMPYDDGGVNPKRPWWMATQRGNLY